MSQLAHFQLMARYNAWMNDKLYAAAGQLSPQALSEDRGAFFPSILATLNHIAVADIIWLKRFAEHPACAELREVISDLQRPAALDQLLFNTFAPLHALRGRLDRHISNWVAALTEQDLEHVLAYGNMKGVPAQRPYASLMLHFFNHQTHHRGQASTLLHQAGQDIGVTDLLALIADIEPR
ncbi:MAG: damage-inducible protein DinB [Pseudomonas sp.]|uniref:DinB family protein n=1 Tax=Pseudomonas sp. FEMGT703P TaxID=2080764 RepID=UPI000CA9F967|nr:DinB family protein [Pseudomonas sp. FEMGT703P]PJE44855.1 MAG: damage-inducible protein DinB [Pseudomonas sp.] [Pseudomonas sp. FEMGT703P]